MIVSYFRTFSHRRHKRFVRRRVCGLLIIIIVVGWMHMLEFSLISNF